VGDHVVVAYADRYAPDQYEAEVPTTLAATQLVASGGIASSVLSRSRAVRSATDIVPIGLIGDDRGRPLSVADFALLPPPVAPVRPPGLVVCGTSMNSGKTTINHYLVHSLSRLGLRPGATKVTGTGSGNDYWVMLDAGAHQMLDFTDVGLASTYRQPVELLERKIDELLDLLSDAGCGYTLVEIADGIFQQETAELIGSDSVHRAADRVVFAGGDAMGAALGVERLRALGHDVVAISGVICRSPLAMREAANATGLPVLGTAELSDLDVVTELLGLPATIPPLPEALGDQALALALLEPTTLGMTGPAAADLVPGPRPRVESEAPAAVWPQPR
jgi:hypothetical protein